MNKFAKKKKEIVKKLRKNTFDITRPDPTESGDKPTLVVSSSFAQTPNGTRVTSVPILPSFLELSFITLLIHSLGVASQF